MPGWCCILFWTKEKESACSGEIPEQKRRPLCWEGQTHIWVDHSHLQLKVINQQCTVSPLHTTEFHSESALVSPVCCKSNNIGLSSVQSLSSVWLFVTPWTTAHQASLSITNSRSPPKPMSIESVTPSNYLILCRPLLLRYPGNPINYVVLYCNKFIILFI